MAVHHAQLNPLVHELEKDLRIAFVVADFNPEITHELERLNKEYLTQQGFSYIETFHVPGAFELPAMTMQIVETGIYHLIITIGCLIKGETPHFDIIAASTTQGLMNISMSFPTPIIFGLLTCNTMEQAQARIDHNYAIYGLNYLVQHIQAQETIEQTQERITEETNEALSRMPT